MPQSVNIASYERTPAYASVFLTASAGDVLGASGGSYSIGVIAASEPSASLRNIVVKQMSKRKLHVVNNLDKAIRLLISIPGVSTPGSNSDLTMFDGVIAGNSDPTNPILAVETFIDLETGVWDIISITVTPVGTPVSASRYLKLDVWGVL